MTWTEEFDKEFGNEQRSVYDATPALKTFIHQQIDQAREEGRKEVKGSHDEVIELYRQRIIGLIEGMKKIDPGADGQYDGAVMYGWNQALDTLKEKI